MVKYTIDLDWKKEILSGAGTEQDPYVYGNYFNICMNDMETWFRANCGTDYCGNSSDSNLRLHFLEEPSQTIKDAIQAKWNSLTPSSSETTTYKTCTQRAIDAAAAKASAITALATAANLTEQQIKNLLT